MSDSRRRFLQGVAGTTFLCLADEVCLGSLTAFAAEPPPEKVRFSKDIEPIVRLIEDTPRGAQFSRPQSGPPPWTETDAQGRFELRQLPDQPIELMAFRANTKGGQIRYPAKMTPALNQQTIRIVFDPTLDEDIEDLDAPRRPENPKK